MLIQFILSFLRQKYLLKKKSKHEKKKNSAKCRTPEEHAVSKTARRDQCVAEEASPSVFVCLHRNDFISFCLLKMFWMIELLCTKMFLEK